jgi:WD40 repeat protein
LGSVRLRMTDGGVFSPDGKTIAASGRLWSAATGKELRRLAPDKEWQPGPLQFSPDGKLLAVGIWGTIGVIDVATGQPAWTTDFSDRVKACVVSFCFTDSGKMLTAALDDGSVVWFDVANGKRTRLWRAWPKKRLPESEHYEYQYEGFCAGSFSADGKILIVGVANVYESKTSSQYSASRTVAVLDIAESKELWRVECHGKASFAISGDGKLVAVATKQLAAEVREVISGKARKKIPFQAAGDQWWRDIDALAFSPDSNRLAIASDDITSVTIHTLTDDAKVQKLNIRVGDGDYRRVRSLRFSPDGRTLLIQGWASAQLYDVASGLAKTSLEGHLGPVWYLHFSADGRLHSGSCPSRIFPAEVLTWNTSTWQVTRRSVLADQLGYLVTASADHELALVVKPPPQPGTQSYDRGLDRPKIVNRAAGKDIGTIMVEQSTFLRSQHGSYFSPCGRFLVVRGKRNGEDAQCCFALPSQLLFQVPPRYGPDQWAFSADGNHVALFESDGLCIRSLVSGKVLHRLSQPAPDARPREIASAFAPTGLDLASWNSVDDEVRIWNVKTGRPLLTLPVKYGWGGNVLVGKASSDANLRFALVGKRPDVGHDQRKGEQDANLGSGYR